MTSPCSLGKGPPTPKLILPSSLLHWISLTGHAQITEQAAAKAREATGIKTEEVAGKAKELKHEAKGKAYEAEGKVKGTAEEVKGKMWIKRTISVMQLLGSRVRGLRREEEDVYDVVID
jgi:hypothetical protein